MKNKFHQYTKKYSYYAKWYVSLSSDERDGIIGKWVYGNAQMYHALLTTELDQVPRIMIRPLYNSKPPNWDEIIDKFSRNVGNYE